MTGQVVAMFATPVYVVGMPDAVAMNRELLERIVQHRDDAAGVSKSNLGGWQSDIDMLSWGGPPARALADRVIAACDTVTRSVGTDRPVTWEPEMWANVNRSGDSNQSHWHPGSYLSFVYYVDDGYAGSGDKALGGELVFVDPRMPFLRMRTPYLRTRNANGAIEEHETWIRPYSGLLIGFPSFMPHSVRPYRGSGARISIAINLAARRAS